MKPSVRFINQDQSKFFPTLRARVNQYFKDNEITKYGNREMVIKSVVLIGIYLLSYLAILLFSLNAWLFVPIVMIMGVAKAGIGMSVMHDALHGSYSKHTLTNTLMGNTIYMVGVNAFVWKVQHNMFHHTYTNIHGLDEDIDTKVVIRLSKHAPVKRFHRFQHIYAFLLYGLLTLRMIFDDGMKLINYHRLGIVKQLKSHSGREFLRLASFKLLYLFFTLVLPVLLTSLLWWQVAIGFVLMHLIAGVILSTVFQLAHIVEGAHQPMPNAVGNIENAWAIHQLETTANFARNSRLLNWYIGGLNFQIEHHLFPNICHVHYRKISGIVEQTAADFDLPYNLKPTFKHALQSHVRMLKTLGQATDSNTSPVVVQK